jgi:RNA polymerase sigma factor for flagellar operon FliA
VVPVTRPSIRPVHTPIATLPPGARAVRMMATVRKVASGLARRLPRRVDIEDLIGAGSLGLADAFSRRGSMPGPEFEAFASYRIRGAMLDELRRQDGLTRRSRRTARRIADASRAVEQKLGRPARHEEVAAELQLELDAFEALRTKVDANRNALPLSSFGGDDDASFEFPDSNDVTPDELAARMELGVQVAAQIAVLPERTRAILSAIYVEGTTLKEIGESFGVSESRVCQIHSEVIAELRAGLDAAEEGRAAVSPNGRKRRSRSARSNTARKALVSPHR